MIKNIKFKNKKNINNKRTIYFDNKANQMLIKNSHYDTSPDIKNNQKHNNKISHEERITSICSKFETFTNNILKDCNKFRILSQFSDKRAIAFCEFKNNLKNLLKSGSSLYVKNSVINMLYKDLSKIIESFYLEDLSILINFMDDKNYSFLVKYMNYYIQNIMLNIKPLFF